MGEGEHVGQYSGGKMNENHHIMSRADLMAHDVLSIPAAARRMAQRVAALEDIVSSLQERVTAQRETIGDLQAKLACMSMTGNDVFFTGCNVHVRNGLGATTTGGNSLGNLIIGYNEDAV